MSKLDFNGKVVVVTGAGQGLGRSHALAYAARGARLVINDLGSSVGGDGQNRSVAQTLADEIRSQGGEAVANTDSVEDGGKIIACAMDTYGQVDVLVNNAGVLRDAAFHKMTDADWDTIYRVHMLGAFRTTQAAWPHMRAAGYGRIVMTASAAGIYGNFGQTNYSAMKLGLHGFAQSLAIEGASKGILVNTIAPVAASRLTETVIPKAVLDTLKPELVTPLVLWLTHTDCDATGQLFEAGGGWIAQVRWERSQGAFPGANGAMTAEDVRDAWGTIRDFTDSVRPRSITETFEPIAKATGVAISLSPQ